MSYVISIAFIYNYIECTIVIFLETFFTISLIYISSYNFSFQIEQKTLLCFSNFRQAIALRVV